MKTALKWTMLSNLGIFAGSASAEPLGFFKNMAGCFAVTYSFVEDGVTDAFYSPVMEKAVVSEEASVVKIQRTLLVAGLEQKHWREEWRQLESNAKLWEQSVYGPYGDFRYRCSGSLLAESWRCVATNSPKPRRDKDQPYTTLDRENTLKVNEKRWVHMQKNSKHVADGGLFAVELGWNLYERRAAAACELQAEAEVSPEEL